MTKKITAINSEFPTVGFKSSKIKNNQSLTGNLTTMSDKADTFP